MKDLSFDPAKNVLCSWSDTIKLRVEFPELEKGIVPLINTFGQLYWGYLSPEYTQQIYTQKKRQLLDTLLSWQQVEYDSPDILPHLWFMLDFIRRPLPEQWDFPCLLVKNQADVQWQTGGTRIMVSGMLHRDPAQHLTALVVDSNNSGVKDLLTSAVALQTDQDLLEHVPTTDHLRLTATVTTQNNCPQLSLTAVDQGHRFDDHNHLGAQYYKEFKAWHQQHRQKTLIKIYTDWPELIYDSSSLWTAEVVGSVTDMKKQITLPGNLERVVFHHHFFDRSDSEYTMWIVEPRAVDLAELAFWLNLDHSTFIDRDWNFAVYRKSSQYLSTFISLSRLKSNKYQHA